MCARARVCRSSQSHYRAVRRKGPGAATHNATKHATKLQYDVSVWGLRTISFRLWKYCAVGRWRDHHRLEARVGVSGDALGVMASAASVILCIPDESEREAETKFEKKHGKKIMLKQPSPCHAERSALEADFKNAFLALGKLYDPSNNIVFFVTVHFLSIAPSSRLRCILCR